MYNILFEKYITVNELKSMCLLYIYFLTKTCDFTNIQIFVATSNIFETIQNIHLFPRIEWYNVFLMGKYKHEFGHLVISLHG